MSPVEELLFKLIRPVRVLIVEDDTALAQVLSAQLNRRYECEIAWMGDGVLAIEYVKGAPEQPDMVLLNLSLPGASGVDVLRTIKRRWPEVPVVVVTGYADSHLALEAAAVGVFSILAKPLGLLDFDTLFRTFKIRARAKSDQLYFSALAHQNAARAGC